MSSLDLLQAEADGEHGGGHGIDCLAIVRLPKTGYELRVPPPEQWGEDIWVAWEAIGASAGTQPLRAVIEAFKVLRLWAGPDADTITAEGLPGLVAVKLIGDVMTKTGVSDPS